MRISSSASGAFVFAVITALAAVSVYSTGQGNGMYLTCLAWEFFYGLSAASAIGAISGIYLTTQHREGWWARSWEMLSGISWSSRIGIAVGLALLVFSVLPPLYPSCPFSSPTSSDMVVDAAILPHGTSSPIAVLNVAELDFEVSIGYVYSTFSFTNMWSNSSLLVALPFQIGRVFNGSNTQLSYFFVPVFHDSLQITQYSWVENVTFRSSMYSTGKLLNGTVSMSLQVTGDMMKVGPWQNSLFLSIGSGTSPMCYRFSRCGLFLKSNVTVGVIFPQNQIIGAGTFPTPDWITTNQYSRIVAWRFPASDHYYDLQLSLEAASFSGPWPFEPFPASWEQIAFAAAFVILQVSLTRAISQMIKTRQDSAE